MGTFGGYTFLLTKLLETVLEPILWQLFKMTGRGGDDILKVSESKDIIAI